MQSKIILAFFLVAIMTKNACSSLTIEEVREANDLITTYPLYKQLNHNISEEDFIANFEKAKDQNYQLYKATLSNNDEPVLIGLIGFQFIQQLYNGRYMHIDSLVINHDYRQKGFGKELMDFAYSKYLEDKQSNNCRDMRLETGVSRLEAQKFYENKVGLQQYTYGYKIV